MLVKVILFIIKKLIFLILILNQKNQSHYRLIFKLYQTGLYTPL